MMYGLPFFWFRYEYATAPLPPGLLTTLIGTVTIFSSARTLVMLRANMSLPPPAAACTTNSMGLSGFQLEAGSLGISVPDWAAKTEETAETAIAAARLAVPSTVVRMIQLSS